ncbi:DNA-binding TFAR19-related protein [Methanohalobium evestigatum Z-7303]|uniref:DNA-binding protein Metev_0738 n=2 Tax=Methanohalobium TaxID=2321 RepID=D7E715_METEZ|nr:DNA-binding protein [Methanohalobium evestigatum]ADI73639.1 DNA-binding TFAR19-related protein [Methanohalobium evestigatum Z-7303]
MSDELEEIRRKKREQIQQQQQAAQQPGIDQYANQQEQAERMEEEKKKILRQILTPDARERLTRLKMSRNELGEQLESQLISLAQSGRIQSVIDDEKLKQLLSQIQPKKHDTNIRRV